MLTSVPVSSARRRVVYALCAAMGLLALAALPLDGQTNAPSYRTISGVITDDQHEPLHGAVVELENPANHQVVSYLTAADGYYVFRRVDSHTDFRLWATFRGHRSAVHEISLFDSHLEKVINIMCKTY